MSKTVEWYRSSYDGGDSAGYEHRARETALAERWAAALDKTIAEFQAAE